MPTKTDWEKRVQNELGCDCACSRDDGSHWLRCAFAIRGGMILALLREFAEEAAGVNKRKARELRANEDKPLLFTFTNSATQLEEAADEILAMLPKKED